MDQKLEILDQLDELGIGFGPGITEPRHSTDGKPYPLTPSHPINVLPAHDSPLYVPLVILPIASDEPPKHPISARMILDGTLDELLRN
jgi:hypothetical protein